MKFPLFLLLIDFCHAFMLFYCLCKLFVKHSHCVTVLRLRLSFLVLLVSLCLVTVHIASLSLHFRKSDACYRQEGLSIRVTLVMLLALHHYRIIYHAPMQVRVSNSVILAEQAT